MGSSQKLILKIISNLDVTVWLITSLFLKSFYTTSPLPIRVNSTLFFKNSKFIARRSNQSILKEISPGYSLEGMMLKLKLQYFGHLMQRVDSLEKTLTLGGLGSGGEGIDRRWDGWMASPTRWTWVWVNSRSWWWTGRPVVLQFMGSQRVGHDWMTELNWTEMFILGFQGFNSIVMYSH